MTLQFKQNPKEVSSPSQWIAVLGGSSKYTEQQVLAAYRAGEAIAKQNKNVITGATTGLPYAASIGAAEFGALTVGISPAGSYEEHVEDYNKPVDAKDLIVYSGMSVDGRGPLIIRSASACIVLGGEFGTLNEFTAAWLVGKKVIGVLTGNGGIADMIPELMKNNRSTWGSVVIFDDDPVSLVRNVCNELDQVALSYSKVETPLNQCDDIKHIINKNRKLLNGRVQSQES